MKKYLQKRAVNLLIKGLLKGVSKDDVLKIAGQDKDGNITAYLGDKKLSSEEIRRLKADAVMIQKSLLWKVIGERARNKAIEGMTSNATSELDIYFGKAAIWIIDQIQQKLIDDISKW